jgi:signal transduction histidine kinase
MKNKSDLLSDNHFLRANEHRLLGLMLFCLLAAVHSGDYSTLGQSFLIVHFGLFLLWQPVIKQNQSFTARQLVLLLVLVASFIYWFNPWLNAFWALSLMSLLCGRIFARGLARIAYGLAVITLFLELILFTTPDLFNLVALSSSVKEPASLLLMLLPLALIFFPVKDSSTQKVDFISGLAITVLIIFLCMASALVSLSNELPYIQSLVSSALIISMFLLLTAFLWTPRTGFSGLARLWERYLLNIGGPFEQWLTHVATLEANNHIQPSHFLSASLKYLNRQDWISGVRWQTETDHGIEGVATAHDVSLHDEKLQLTIYTYTPIGPSLLLHSKLLLNVLTFYYRAKLQEQLLIKQAHMKAIYETGSKLTHDVKNILQSTQTMSQIINDTEAETGEVMRILKNQMPILTQRLNSTLDKLRSPQKNIEPSRHTGSLLHWWNQLQQRYTGRHIRFEETIDQDRDINLDVLTTVTENLLDNARSKRISQPDLEIRVTLVNADKHFSLTVADTGKPIPAEVHAHLLKEVVPSESGFGIGLYQSSELAMEFGFKLEITSNAPGDVSFSLQAPAAAS